MILVTGASGFIGLHLVRALVGAGEEVRALVRSDEGADRVRRAASEAGAPDVDVVRGDVTDPDSLAGVAKGCEVVHHLAGEYRGAEDELRRVHVEGTANLLAVLDPGTRLVLLSSTSVYGWERVWPADDATPPRPASAYGLAKLRAEQLVRGWKEGEAVVVRPTITYGPGDTRGMLARAVTLLRRGVRWFPGDGTNRVHLLHVDDLTAGLVRLTRSGRGTFLLAGPEAAPIARILGLLARGAGVPPPRFVLPTALVRPAASAVEAAWARWGAPTSPPLTPHSVDVLTRDRAYSPRRAEAELGWRARVGLEEGVPATGAWLARNLPPASTVREGARPAARGFEWRGYFTDPDEGLGTVYERFALDKVLRSAVRRTGSRSLLHAPLFGMMGVPGLDAVLLARSGLRVGLLDFEPERLEAVRAQWAELGLEPETHLVPSADPATWPEELPAAYDLVFSFAALWWFDDPFSVLAAQARWARRGVLVAVPNKNVFMRMRARLWHRRLFEELNEEALDAAALVRAGQEAGLVAVDEGLFDIPPFPDTSVPLARVLRAMRRRGQEAPASPEGAWRWSIVPYLKGEQPDLDLRIERLTGLERRLPAPVAPHLAHHRYLLFVTPPEASPSPATAHST